jgi:hypothetical protein
MQHVRRTWIRLVIAATVGCVSAAAVGPTASASVRRAYTLVVSPTHVRPATSTRFFVALTNTSSRGTPLGSMKVSPPAGFRLKRAVLPPGAHGSALIRKNVLVLRRLSVVPGSTLQVRVTVTSPAVCEPPARWRSTAWEGQFGGGKLALRSANSRASTGVSCPYSLRFVTQPRNAVVGEAIRARPDDPAGPPLTVQVVDGSGHLVRVATPVTLALGKNPGHATLAGTKQGRTVAGQITFGDLRLDKTGNGYTLSASSPGLTSAVSNPFNENNTAAICEQGASCMVSLQTAASAFQVMANPTGPGTPSGTLSVSADVGNALDCTDDGYKGRDPNWYEFVESTGQRVKTITYTIKNTTPDGIQSCFGAPYQFTTSSGGSASAEPLPDGSNGFVGLLPSCDSTSGSGPCTSITTSPDKASSTGIDTILTLQIPAGLEGDPWAHG